MNDMTNGSSAPAPGAATHTPTVPGAGVATMSPDAAAQLEQLRTDRIAGRVTEWDYLARAEQLSRVASTSPPALNAEAAAVQLEQLRAARLAGHVTEADYLARAEYLARVASGESGVTAPATTRDQSAEQFIEQTMAPPSDISAYGQLPRASDISDEGAQSLDTAIRTSLLKGGIPTSYAGSIVEGIFRNWRALGGASDSEIAEHVSRAGDRLRARWGDEFEARSKRVGELVADMTSHDAKLAAIVDANPWMVFSDALIVDLLDRVAERRVRRK